MENQNSEQTTENKPTKKIRDAQWWRDYRIKNADKLREYKRKHNQKVYRENKERETERRKKWSKENADKVRSYRVTREAIRSNKLETGVCEICGKDEVYAYRADYSKPLEIRWLCPVHLHEVKRSSK